MSIFSAFLKIVRNSSLTAILALLLYVLPNVVQDAHRVFGHYHTSYPTQATTSENINQNAEKCPVCVFEFYSVDETPATIVTVLLTTCNTIFRANESHQLTSEVFDYSQLRAPPVS